MKRKMLVVSMVVLMLAVTASSVWAEDDYNIVKESHKVRNKWDISGAFQGYPGYNWGGLAPNDAIWTYKIHIKEAMNGDCSVGSIHLATGDIDVVGNVKATKRYINWGAWTGHEILAAVGTADYNDQTYYFMFLYGDPAIWFALSETPYDSYWAVNSLWPTARRAYQVHSLWGDYPLDYKPIHE